MIFSVVKYSQRVQQGKYIIHEHLKSVLSSREIESLISAILRKADELSKKDISREFKIDEFNNELLKISQRFNELMTDEQGMFKLIFIDDREDNEYNRRMYFFHLFMPLNNAVIDEYF